MSELTGIPQSTYSGYERGTLGVYTGFLVKLHRIYGVNPNYITLGIGSILTTKEDKTPVKSQIAELRSQVLALSAVVDYLAKRGK
ncbi:helix-turn-helix domain-containing protein [Pedobacter cryoconitis]|nr:helix-turn-helix transcriptional regulator [Pedobacter cryoconitis]